MADEKEYILGTDADEIARLRFQHKAWLEQAYSLWERAGLRHGDVVLDLGCGPGFTSFELADVVGPEGRVIARDVSPRFLDFLKAERDRRRFANVESSLGPVEELDLPEASIDAAYARWLFCWLPDPGEALQRVARCLRPGGALLLQDYLDWGAMKLVPPDADHDLAVSACMRSWEEGEGTIDVAELIPGLAAECGLRVEFFQPISRLGAVGSLEWRWLGEFLASYLPKLVERGTFTRAEFEAFQVTWAGLNEAGTSYIFTPTVADIILRKP